MGEKVYRPILKDGNHLVGSKDNPDRVRGLARDENNQNPDIPEWEEIDLDDLRSDTDIDYHYEQTQIELSPEEQELLEKVGIILATAVVRGGELLFQDVIIPWWRHHALPWIRAKNEARREKKRNKSKHYANNVNFNSLFQLQPDVVWIASKFQKNDDGSL